MFETSLDIEIGIVAKNAPLLNEVKALYRKNASTLGFYPNGAFDEAALRSQIFSATNNSKLVGYLLYRVARDYRSITHLCVRDDAKGKGVARSLVSALIADTPERTPIRRDITETCGW